MSKPVEFDPDKHIDEFVVLNADEVVVGGRHASEPPAIEYAKKLRVDDPAVHVMRMRMTYTLVAKRKYVDYENPIDELKVWPSS